MPDKKLPKVTKSFRIDPELLKRIEWLNKKSNGYVTFSMVLENGAKKEIAALEKMWNK